VGDDRLVTNFLAPDGTRLAYHETGTGQSLVCLPGGPMQSSAYLGRLGGLDAHRTLILVDPRGTGDSAVPEDPQTYRCDRLVDDVEALRRQLGRVQLDVLGHSAGATLAVLYAARYPDRVRRLVLVTPSPRAVGLAVSDLDRRAVAELRRDEQWFPEAFRAFEKIWAGQATDADWAGIAPFNHGRWDDSARAHDARRATEQNEQAAARYYAEGAIDPPAIRSALARLDSPVLLLAGGYDVGLPPARAQDYAAMFPRGELVLVPGAGHYPWRDDADAFVRSVADFLRGRSTLD
jgi:pimeloyl-ACP methyl ester carboxylesterase